MNMSSFGERLRRSVAWGVRVLLPALLALAWLPAAPMAAQDDEPVGTLRAAISEPLAQELAAANGPVSFLVVLRWQPDAGAILASNSLQSASAEDRRTALYAALTDQAERSQATLRAWLDARSIPYTPHYLVNMIEVQGDAALAEQLRLQPTVDRLARNPSIRQTHAASPYGGWQRFPLHETRAGAALPYGLTYTHADQVWALGYHGEGIVIGSQDTGVQWDHPALRADYRGWDNAAMTVTHPYNWFDAFGRDPLQDSGCNPDPQVPCDDQGHGTHTVGTMVGDATADGGEILGMAPAAQWIGCRNMRGGVGSPSSYTTCFEWFLAPYPQGGDPFRDGRPELAPDIVNNSWGCPPSEGCDVDTLRQVVDTVRAAGVFIAASAGNDGWMGCSSITDPIGIYDSVFTVGAHDAQGAVAYFSSLGPVTADGSGRLKPDLSAPGVSVYSSYPGNSYTSMSGTSMASPHVAGAVALLWSAVPSLAGNIDLTEEILIKSATPVTVNTCDSGFVPVSPNNAYGYGRLDVFAAINLARQPVTVTVSLVTSDSLPMAGRALQLVDQRTARVYSGVTDAAGQVMWDTEQAQLTPGSYDLRAQECTTFTDAGSIELPPGEAASRTVVTASTICRFIPWIER